MPATGAVSFDFNVYSWGIGLYGELRERAVKMKPLFDSIIDGWREHNFDKFMLSQGMEGTGVDFNPQPSWLPVTEKYAKQKRRDGFPDWLMVRTGATAAALTTEGSYLREVHDEGARFGTPNDQEEADKVMFNWESRQAIFLDRVDMKNVAVDVNDYFTLGPKFKDIKFRVGQDNAESKTEGEWIFEGGA